jgi:hypothetical protein
MKCSHLFESISSSNVKAVMNKIKYLNGKTEIILDSAREFYKKSKAVDAKVVLFEKTLEQHKGNLINVFLSGSSNYDDLIIYIIEDAR